MAHSPVLLLIFFNAMLFKILRFGRLLNLRSLLRKKVGLIFFLGL